jgi:Skp family chaperone for outer membrane proteins
MDQLAKENYEIQRLRLELRGGEDYEAIKARIAALGAAYNRHQEDQRHQFDDEQKRVIQNLSAKLIPVIEKYAKQKHLEVVLDISDAKTPVVWIAPQRDITDEIIKLYDRASKKP